MVADETENEVLHAISDGLEEEKGSFHKTLTAVLSGKRVKAIKELVAFVQRLMVTETPDDPNKIKELSKEQIQTAVFRMNFFEKLRRPALNDDQLEALYQRVIELWGEAPTEPIGRWAEWNIWVTRHRRQKGISLTELIEGSKTVADIQQTWAERHEAREERRQFHKMQNYDQYEVPEDVPPSLQHIVMSPLISDEEEIPDTVETNIETVREAVQADVEIGND